MFFKIPRNKLWAWSEVKIWNNSIEIQKHFVNESNHHSVWDATGKMNLTKKKLLRLSVVPYAAVEWPVKGGRTPN